MPQRDTLHNVVRRALIRDGWEITEDPFVIYLAVSNVVFDEFFREPIGELVIERLPLQLVVVDPQESEVTQWIPWRPSEKS